MTTITQITTVHKKDRARFESGFAANASRFTGHDDLYSRCIAANDSMYGDETFAGAISRVWNRDDFTLTIVKTIKDLDKYNEIWSSLQAELDAVDTINGWVKISETSQEI